MRRHQHLLLRLLLLSPPAAPPFQGAQKGNGNMILRPEMQSENPAGVRVQRRCQVSMFMVARNSGGAQMDPTWIGIWGCIFWPIPYTSGCMGNRSDRNWICFRTHRNAQGAHSDRNCVPFSTRRETGVPIRIAIAPHSAPTGVYGSQILTSQKNDTTTKSVVSRVLPSQKIGTAKI